MREHYEYYPDAEMDDRDALAQLLTALTLCDELVWDGSSIIQESQAMNDARFDDAWIYDWFPIFRLMHDNGLLRHVVSRGSEDRLLKARLAALRWVKERYVTREWVPPQGFHVPLSCSLGTHEDSAHFVYLNNHHGLQLRDEEVELALFLHRGLFYQSRVRSQAADGWSYLPHHYRAAVLQDVPCGVLSALCADEVTMGPAAISPTELLETLDARFFRQVTLAARVPPRKAGYAIGTAFLAARFHAADAVSEALWFRATDKGEQLRAIFRELVVLGQDSNIQGIERQLQQLERELANEARHIYGTGSEPDRKSDFLIDLTGTWKGVVQPLLSMVPLRVRDAVTRALYTSVPRSGFQILFRKYVGSE